MTKRKNSTAYESSPAMFTVAGSLRTNLKRSSKSFKKLPAHLHKLAEAIGQAHKQMASINYEAHLYANLNLAKMIDLQMPLPALDVKFGLSILNDVSVQDPSNPARIIGRPTECPYYEVPMHPFFQSFKSSLKNSIKFLKDETSKLHRPEQFPSWNPETLPDPPKFDKKTPIFLEDVRAKPERWDPPPTDPNSPLPECLQLVRLLFQQIIEWGPSHCFSGFKLKWKIERIFLLCNSIQNQLSTAFDGIQLIGPLNESSRPLAIPYLVNLLAICKYLLDASESSSTSGQVWTHIFRPESLSTTWAGGLNEYKALRRREDLTSRKHLSQIIGARALEIAETAANHIVRNVRLRVRSFVLWKLELNGVSTSSERHRLASPIVKAMFDLDWNPEPQLAGIGRQIFEEMVNQIKTIPFLSWSPSSSLLPLRDHANFCDQSVMPAYLYLFRYFETQYRKDPLFAQLPQETLSSRSDPTHQQLNPTKKSKFMHFSLFPLAKLRGCFIEIEHLALFDLVQSLEIKTRSQFKNFKDKGAKDEEKKALFKEVFDYDTSNDKRVPNFGAGIKTDGESIRLCMYDMTKPAVEMTLNAKDRFTRDIKEIQNASKSKKVHVYGLDPGIKRPVQVVNLAHHRNRDGKRVYRTSQISNGHYHRLTWSIRHWHLKAKRLKKPGGETAAELMAKMPSGRTTDHSLFSLLVKHAAPSLNTVLVPFSTARKVKSWRFRALRHRQSALAFVVRRVLCACDRPEGLCSCRMDRYSSDSTTTAVVAYGAAAFNTSMPGNAPAPKARIARGIERLAKVKVVMVDEFRTSRRCCECHHPLSAPASAPQPNAYQGVLQCSNSNCRAHGKFWNRDVNACINIGFLLLFALSSGDPLQRPDVFKRSTAYDALPSQRPSFACFEKFDLTPPSYLLGL